eukprot:COSAG06_NODE_62078_length_266_cov_0.604790_1_plen_60_part_01
MSAVADPWGRRAAASTLSTLHWVVKAQKCAACGRGGQIAPTAVNQPTGSCARTGAGMPLM